MTRQQEKINAFKSYDRSIKEKVLNIQKPTLKESIEFTLLLFYQNKFFNTNLFPISNREDTYHRITF